MENSWGGSQCPVALCRQHILATQCLSFHRFGSWLGCFPAIYSSHWLHSSHTLFFHLSYSWFWLCRSPEPDWNSFQAVWAANPQQRCVCASGGAKRKGFGGKTSHKWNEFEFHSKLVDRGVWYKNKPESRYNYKKPCLVIRFKGNPGSEPPLG